MALFNLKEISANEFTAFVEGQKIGCPLQTAGWGKVKDDAWTSMFVGLYDEENNIHAGSMILVRKIISGFKMAYLPRGPIFDEWCQEKISAFTAGMKTIMKNHGVTYYVIDPVLIHKSSSIGQHEDEIFNYWKNPEEEFNKINEMLKKAGLKHKGFSKKLSETIQPRINVFVPLAKDENTFLSMDELKKTFNKRTRECIGAYHEKRGISFEKVSPTQENIHILSEFVQLTADKKNINLRGENYFKKICENMGEDAPIYFAYADLSKYIDFLCAKRTDEVNEKLEKEIKELEEMKAVKGNKVVLCAMLHIFPPNKEGIRIVDYIYSGTDISLSAFRNLQIASGLMYFTMGDCIERKCQYLNLGGIHYIGDDDLYKFKARFNSLIYEYGGEWDGVISSGKYVLISKMLPIAKKMLSLVKHK